MAKDQVNRRRVLGLGAAAAAAGAVALVPAVHGATRAEAARSSPELEGTWRSTVTAVNPPLGSFASLITFTAGGGVVESRRPYVPLTPFGPILETAGHGRWERSGSHGYRVDFVFLIQGAPDNPHHAGAPLGTDNIHWEPVLEQSGGTQQFAAATLSGPFHSEARDEAGNVVFAVDGVIEATRFVG